MKIENIRNRLGLTVKATSNLMNISVKNYYNKRNKNIKNKRFTQLNIKTFMENYDKWKQQPPPEPTTKTCNYCGELSEKEFCNKKCEKAYLND